MLSVLDTVITSSDLSIERVLQTGLPAILLFYDNEPPEALRRSSDDLACQYAGKVLIVRLDKKESTQTASRFNVHQFPSLVALKDRQPVSRKDFFASEDILAHIAYLLGQGPLPVSAPSTPPQARPAASQPQGHGPKAVDMSNFEREVLQSDRPVLVDFWAVWCGPCKMMEPALDKLSREKSDRLKVVKLNVDENPDLAGRYNVSGIPTMMVFQNGQPVDRLVGALPEGALRNRLARWLS